ncbi:hypothetical protein [Nannocystis radixulma]|uniref:Ig-like domain-containing protein n=1 Tax=Nannocystis radixulma TaxID=2995305 RepID=A0ABT5B1F5_9BACT|nr:hypothetical protein [Nannocystis radixulma]MDC0667916.1 hypothetical protein [Nannocystis radixulma]
MPSFALVLLVACGPGAGSSDTASSSGDSPATTTGDDPTTTSDTTGPALPPECESSDPLVAAGFAVEFPDWPADVSLPSFEFFVCDIDEVTTGTGVVTTNLTCDVEGTPRPVVVTIDAAPEGEVAWAAGQTVRLRHDDFEGDGSTKYLHMHRVDDEDDVLILALDSTEGDALEVWAAPLTIDIEFVCDPDMGAGQSHPTLLRFALPDGSDSLGLVSGHRGVLGIDDESQYVIDLAESFGNDLHPEDRVNFLVRRTAGS